jgi:hypothetical protein
VHEADAGLAMAACVCPAFLRGLGRDGVSPMGWVVERGAFGTLN